MFADGIFDATYRVTRSSLFLLKNETAVPSGCTYYLGGPVANNNDRMPGERGYAREDPR